MVKSKEYDPSYPDKLWSYSMKRGGITKKQAAEFFGVSLPVILRWCEQDDRLRAVIEKPSAETIMNDIKEKKMEHRIENSLDKLEVESNEHRGRLDALNMLAKIFLEGLKEQNQAGYDDLKEMCMAIATENVAAAESVEEQDLEEQAQAFYQEIDMLFADMDELEAFQDTH